VYKTTGRPFVRSQNVGWGELRLDDLAYIDDVTHTTFPATEIRAGDVLLNITGASIGRSAVATPELDGGNVNQHVCEIRLKRGVMEPRYVCAVLNSRIGQNQIDAFQAGGNRQGLNFQQVGSIRVPAFDFRHQRSIGVALQDADELISRLERLIAKKQAIKHGMMQQLLTGKTRLPGFTGKWDAKPLSEDITLVSGHHVLAQYCNMRGYGVPYLTGPSDFPDGRIRQTKFTDKPKSLCHANDLLLTVKGSGAGTLIQADASYCISRQLMAIRPKEWDSRFLFYSLLQNASNIKDAVTGLIPGLSRSDVLNQTIPVPPVGEQRAIAAVLSDMDEELDSLDACLEKTRDIKQGMMQQLLTGRTRLPVERVPS